MIVTNRGTRKWEVGPGVFARPGDTVTVPADSWRLALALNPALAHAVGTELEVEDEPLPEDVKSAAQPVPAAHPTPTPPAGDVIAGRSTSRSRKGRR